MQQLFLQEQKEMPYADFCVNWSVADIFACFHYAAASGKEVSEAARLGHLSGVSTWSWCSLCLLGPCDTWVSLLGSSA